MASQPILEEGLLPLNTPCLPAWFSTPPRIPSQLQYIPITPSQAKVTPVYSYDSWFYLPNDSLFVPRSYITTTCGSTTPGLVTNDFMESLNRTRSLLLEQRDQKLAHWQREQHQKNKEELQSLCDVSQSQQQLSQILQHMTSNPSRQGRPITPIPAPLATPIHHPTLVPASPVSLTGTVWHIQDLITPKVVSHSIIQIGNKEYVELQYLQNVMSHAE